MDAMGLPFMSPYLDSVGAPDFKSGSNFATGGSTILPVKANAASPFSFGVQVAQFIRFKARVLELLANGKKKSYLFIFFSIKEPYYISMMQNLIYITF